MLEDLKPHAKTKDSGRAWLGDVPDHWQVKRIKRILTEVDDRSEDGEGTLLSLSKSRGLLPQRDMTDKAHSASTLINYRRYKSGQIVMNRMQAWNGLFGACEQSGLVSPDYCVFKIVDDSLRDFLLNLFRTPSLIGQFAILSRGIGTGFNRLYTEDFGAIAIPVPPPEEQAAIARFLAALDRRVNRFVRAKRRLIELLTEQKQAIITHAVTRGLNPNAKLKPSGIDWLGDVPEQWRVVPSQWLFSPRKELSGTDDIQLSATQAYGVIPQAEFEARENRRVVRISMHLEKRRRVERDDFVISMRSFQGGLERAWASGAIRSSYVVLKPSPSVDIEYFSYLFKSATYIAALQRTCDFIRDGQDLNYNNFKLVPLPLPPKEEQKTIAEHVRAAIENTIAALSRTEREITLLREYRTRLVAEVVTGKLDVRDAMIEPVEIAESTPKANIHFRRSVFAAEIVHRLHDEPTFGHVKFEKLIYLCEKRCTIDTGSTYRRQAAGPYDSRALRSIDKQIKKQSWYEARKGEKAYRYFPLSKAGDHSKYFDRYFGNVRSAFDSIINIFRTAKTRQCEIVATLYSAWEDLLAKGSATDDQIIEQVLHHWHPSKQKIEEDRWRRALEWMKKKGLTPKAG